MFDGRVMLAGRQEHAKHGVELVYGPLERIARRRYGRDRAARRRQRGLGIAEPGQRLAERDIEADVVDVCRERLPHEPERGLKGGLCQRGLTGKPMGNGTKRGNRQKHGGCEIAPIVRTVFPLHQAN